ncbi:MAG: HlyD family efflux transporter periplasmic adaptor subunit [Burkholderiales bacterium]|nr:HlyD family efflux transporter periplasmic adaptor subunit [Burkholderiales bacterium]
MSQENPDLQILGSLLQIEQDVRQADSVNAVEFIAVNDTWRIFPYRQACLWRPDLAGKPRLKLVSGLSDISEDSPFRQWLNDALAHVYQTPHTAAEATGSAQLLTLDMLPAQLHDGWQEWMSGQVVLQPLTAPDGTLVGGLWLALDHQAGEAEMALLARLGVVYGHGLWAWRAPAPLWQRAAAKFKTRYRLASLLLLAILCIPLRLTALAPAEIIGKDAKIIAAPADGVVAQFFVEPNQAVKNSTPLFTLDDTSARNRNQLANKARAVAEADYLRATQKSFSDVASKSELASLKAKVEEKSAEQQYTSELMQRIQVAAPENGIVVFSDPNDWLGRPVQTGERIMLLANPAKVQIALHLAVDDALALAPDASVKLYLNVNPLSTLEGHVVQASYEPAAGADGVVAYQLKADLEAGQEVPRIGLKGTAKIYGAWAPLIYHIVRKPLAAARRSLGI